MTWGPLPGTWRDYSRRRATAAVAVVSLLPLRSVAVALDRLGASSGPPRAVLAAWATGCAAALIWFLAFRCPYCREHFHLTLWVANPFSRSCLHCGFPKWKDPAAASRLRPDR